MATCSPHQISAIILIYNSLRANIMIAFPTFARITSSIDFNLLLGHVLSLVTEIELAIINEDFAINFAHRLLHRVNSVLLVLPLAKAQIWLLFQVFVHEASKLLLYRVIVDSSVVYLLLLAF